MTKKKGCDLFIKDQHRLKNHIGLRLCYSVIKTLVTNSLSKMNKDYNLGQKQNLFKSNHYTAL